jgi:bifunctional N-acetylglucosamine-1-phosphate-uridyltransferase/glucosamine-1-phosphate-acetyltransferase GlmU-like protein
MGTVAVTNQEARVMKKVVTKLRKTNTLIHVLGGVTIFRLLGFRVWIRERVMIKINVRIKARVRIRVKFRIQKNTKLQKSKYTNSF